MCDTQASVESKEHRATLAELLMCNLANLTVLVLLSLTVHTPFLQFSPVRL